MDTTPLLQPPALGWLEGLLMAGVVLIACLWLLLRWRRIRTGTCQCAAGCDRPSSSQPCQQSSAHKIPNTHTER